MKRVAFIVCVVGLVYACGEGSEPAPGFGGISGKGDNVDVVAGVDRRLANLVRQAVPELGEDLLALHTTASQQPADLLRMEEQIPGDDLVEKGRRDWLVQLWHIYIDVLMEALESDRQLAGMGMRARQIEPHQLFLIMAQNPSFYLQALECDPQKDTQMQLNCEYYRVHASNKHAYTLPDHPNHRQVATALHEFALRVFRGWSPYRTGLRLAAAFVPLGYAVGAVALVQTIGLIEATATVSPLILAGTDVGLKILRRTYNKVVNTIGNAAHELTGMVHLMRNSLTWIGRALFACHRLKQAGHVLKVDPRIHSSTGLFAEGRNGAQFFFEQAGKGKEILTISFRHIPLNPTQFLALLQKHISHQYLSVIRPLEQVLLGPNGGSLLLKKMPVSTAFQIQQATKVIEVLSKVAG